jgi:hypothetical protein
MGIEAIEKSEMGDELNFIPTDNHTLQSENWENIFVIGDATNLPSSKAGSVAHFESDVLFENLLSYINGEPLNASFDGHANCFIESGDGKGLLIDFNYHTEPTPREIPNTWNWAIFSPERNKNESCRENGIQVALLEYAYQRERTSVRIANVNGRIDCIGKRGAGDEDFAITK